MRGTFIQGVFNPPRYPLRFPALRAGAEKEAYNRYYHAFVYKAHGLKKGVTRATFPLILALEESIGDKIRGENGS